MFTLSRLAMKHYFLFILTMCQLSTALAQINPISARLDSSIRALASSYISPSPDKDLDSTTDHSPKVRIGPCRSNLLSYHQALVILNGKPVHPKKSAHIPAQHIKAIYIYPENDPVTQAIYGSRGQHGVIVIQTK